MIRTIKTTLCKTFIGFVFVLYRKLVEACVRALRMKASRRCVQWSWSVYVMALIT